MSTLFLDAGREEALIVDENWLLDVAVTLAGLNAGADTLNDLAPPPALHDLHTVVRQLAGELKIAVEMYVESIDELDADKMDTANDHMDNALDRAFEAQQARTRPCG